MRLSIVTPSFNQRAFLQQTMRSVLGQENVELRWIVIDGGSTDGTVEFLKSIDDQRLRWISEPDRGQANAVNKGLALADGEVIGWINSDDLYMPGVLTAVAEKFFDSNTHWLAGRCEIINDVGAVIRPQVTAYKDALLRRYSYRRLLRENFLSQPAVFWRREVGQRAGKLDESLHYTMDYDFWLRMGKLAEPVILDRVLAQFRMHTASKSGQVKREQFDEGFRVACRYFECDRMSRCMHRFNVEKIVWSYRLMRLIGK